jgi:signal transduction histidine kinase
MLSEFLVQHRGELIARAREKVASRSAPRPTEAELECGVPLFLDELGEVLRLSLVTNDKMTRSAGAHGRALLRTGFTVAQVVHDYGDICQVVTELAGEVNAPITVDEFHTMNRCLDDAIAEAVTEYSAQRERSIEDAGTYRLGTVVHEVRGRLSTAMMALSLLEQGNVGIGGSTGAILKRSLRAMGTLLDHSFAEVRLASGTGGMERVLVSELVEEIEVDGSIEATSRGLALSCSRGEPGLHVRIDRQLIAAALANLLHNAFKFTRADGHVSLRTLATSEHVRFEIEDECGGLPAGNAEDLFLPFEQRGADRTGLGLGLDIARRSVEACAGRLQVRDVPGSGCVFTMELPAAR